MNRLTPHKGSVNRIGNLLGFNNASNQAEQPHVGHLHRSTRLDKLNFIDVQTLNQKYRKTARRIWNRQYELSERKCSQCRDCRMRDDNPKKKKEEDPSWSCLPMRNTSKTLLCGCVLQLWDVYAPTVAKGNPNGRRGGRGGRGRYGGDKVEEFVIQGSLCGVLKERFDERLKFILDPSVVDLASAFEIMESTKCGVKFFSISHATMEDIFMNLLLKKNN